MAKNIKEVKETSFNPIAEKVNKQFNEERNTFLKEFRQANSREMIEGLYNFMRLNDYVKVEDDGVYAFGAFGEEFFGNVNVPGQTGLEMYATKKFAQEFTKEYLSLIFGALLQGELTTEKKVAKEEVYDENDVAAKE